MFNCRFCGEFNVREVETLLIPPLLRGLTVIVLLLPLLVLAIDEECNALFKLTCGKTEPIGKEPVLDIGG